MFNFQVKVDFRGNIDFTNEENEEESETNYSNSQESVTKRTKPKKNAVLEGTHT